MYWILRFSYSREITTSTYGLGKMNGNKECWLVPSLSTTSLSIMQCVNVTLCIVIWDCVMTVINHSVTKRFYVHSETINTPTQHPETIAYLHFRFCGGGVIWNSRRENKLLKRILASSFLTYTCAKEVQTYVCLEGTTSIVSTNYFPEYLFKFWPHANMFQNKTLLALTAVCLWFALESKVFYEKHLFLFKRLQGKVAEMPLLASSCLATTR